MSISHSPNQTFTFPPLCLCMSCVWYVLPLHLLLLKFSWSFKFEIHYYLVAFSDLSSWKLKNLSFLFFYVLLVMSLNFVWIYPTFFMQKCYFVLIRSMSFSNTRILAFLFASLVDWVQIGALNTQSVFVVEQEEQ